MKEFVGETGYLEWAAEYRTWGEVKRLESYSPKPRSKPQTQRDQWGFMPLDTQGNTALNADTKPDAYYCPVRFQGQWEDGETGLYYNRFRYYEPGVGYLSIDPLGIIGNTSNHSYVRSANNWVDPDGLQEFNLNPRSRPTWGHTFSEHGMRRNARQLKDRARSRCQAQGQWAQPDATVADCLTSAPVGQI